MKKLMLALFIGCLVLALGGSILACDDDCAQGQVSKQQSITVDKDLWATVHPYAKVCIGDATDLFFTGEGGSKSKSGNLIYNIETNCWVDVKGRGTAFKSTFDTKITGALADYTLATKYSVGRFISYREAAADQDLWLGWFFFGKHMGNVVNYTATTGPEISSQPAGHYKAVYAITVSAPVWDDTKNGFSI